VIECVAWTESPLAPQQAPLASSTGNASVLSRAEAFSFPPGVIHAKTQSQEGQKYRKISKESLGDELKQVRRRRGFEFARQFSGQRFPELGSCHGCWIAGSSCSTGGRSDGQTVQTESQSGRRWQHVWHRPSRGRWLSVRPEPRRCRRASRAFP